MEFTKILDCIFWVCWLFSRLTWLLDEPEFSRWNYMVSIKTDFAVHEPEITNVILIKFVGFTRIPSELDSSEFLSNYLSQWMKLIRCASLLLTPVLRIQHVLIMKCANRITSFHTFLNKFTCAPAFFFVLWLRWLWIVTIVYIVRVFLSIISNGTAS